MSHRTAMAAAAADAYSIAPREPMGKVGMIGAHIQRAPTNTKTGLPAFGDADSVRIGAHVTLDALKTMPVYEDLQRQLAVYFEMVQRSLAGEPVAPLPSTGVNPLLDVEGFLSTLSVPSHDGTRAVYLHELLSSSTARPGTTESVIGLIRALDGAHKTAMSKCAEELSQARRHIGQVSDDIDRTTENLQNADQSLAETTTALSQLALNPSDPAAVEEAAAGAAAAATDLAQARDAAADAGHDVEQTDEHIRKSLQGAANADTPSAPASASESISEWVELMAILSASGTPAYSAGEFDTFFSGRTVKTVSPASLKGDRFKTVVKIQGFIVRRTQLYEESGQASAEVLKHAKESANAFRALARFLSDYSGRPAPAWWKADGTFQGVIANLVAAEYRVHFAIVRGESVLQDMDDSLHKALQWPTFFAVTIGTASSEQKVASALAIAQGAYNRDWADFAT